jgi:hypothetical protein
MGRALLKAVEARGSSLFIRERTRPREEQKPAVTPEREIQLSPNSLSFVSCVLNGFLLFPLEEIESREGRCLFKAVH